MKKHTLPPKDLDLSQALHEERHLLEHSQIPIVTVSATFRKELAKKYKDIAHTPSDVVYSRGHYSMAEAVYQQALKMKKRTHMVDPTNFVSKQNWKKIEFTEIVGELVARHKLLKILKDKMDKIIRGKLPIKEAITPPLIYLTSGIKRPIISMHYETGNILAGKNKRVVQAVTDPHVHSQYLQALPSKNITFAVFDEETRKMFFDLAKQQKKEISADQVVVTGPFVDPRISLIGKTAKKIKKGEPVNIAITTGGIGTNLKEIEKLLQEIKELVVSEKIRLFLFASTHRDFRNYFEDYAAENNIRVGNWDDDTARIRIMHDDSIVDANENLIKYIFPWAHGVITKPSGDMAYDAAAAGCFLLFLSSWGAWEDNVKKVFVREGVGRDLQMNNSSSQIKKLLSSGDLQDSMDKAHNLPSIFRDGCENLIKLQ